VAHEALSKEEPNLESVISGALVPETLAGAAEAALTYSTYLYTSNRFRIDTIRCTISALRAHVPPDRLDLLPQCLYWLGEICSMQGNHDTAIPALTEAKTLFEAGGVQHGTAQCLLSLGGIYRMQDNCDDAIAACTEAKALFEAVSDWLGVTQGLLFLGNIYYTQNNYNAATSTLTTAKASFESMGNRLGAAQCLQSLGDVHRMQNN
jgi:tetratricopeptide (TPR) repeat protein